MQRYTTGATVAAVALALAMPALAAPPAGAQGRMFAVLDFDNRLRGADRAEVDTAYLADTVRTLVQKQDGTLIVMTKGNLITILAQSGKKLEECTKGECTVESGKLVGADLVVGGSVVRLGSIIKVSLELYDTHIARLMNSASATGKDIEELDSKLAKAVTELLEPLRGSTLDMPTLTATNKPELGALPELSAKLKGSGGVVNLNADPDVLVLLDAATRLEPKATEEPLVVAQAWEKLAAAEKQNPYKADAAARARKLRDYAEERRKFNEQKTADRDRLRKVLPLSVVQDQVKHELLVRFARLYGADVDELLKLVPEGGARENAKVVIDCELGRDSSSCLRAAAIYENAKDLSRAASLHVKGCEGGQAESCERIGTMYLGEGGLPPNPQSAGEALGKACDAGRPAACKRLARAAAGGELGKADAQAALALYDRACDLRDPESCVRAADIIRQAQNLAAAVPMYRKACNVGEKRACGEVAAWDKKIADERAEAERQRLARIAELERIEREKQELREKLEAQWKKVKAEKEAEVASIRSARSTGYGVTAGGAVAGALALFFAARSSSNNDDVRNGTFATAAKIEEAVSRGKTYNTLAYVFGGAAALGLGVGIPLVVLNAPSREPEIPKAPAMPPELSISAAPNGVLLTWRLP